MDKWRQCKLGDVVTLKRGYDLPHQDRRPGPFPIVSSSGVTDYHAERKARGPGVVTGRYGTLGEVFFIEGDFWPLNTALYVYDFKGSNPRFVSYFLRQLNFGSRNAAGAVPGVNRNHLHAMEVRVPPVNVQRRIADLLSAYDDVIANCEGRIRVLNEMMGALYREWFLCFRYDMPRTPLLDSPRGPIPEGWENIRFEDVAYVHRGRSYRSAELVEAGGVPFINLKCINREGGFRRSGLKEFSSTNMATHQVRKGDIVVAVTDMTQERRIVGRAGRVPTLDADFGIFSMDLVRIEARPPWPAAWIYGLLRYSAFADHVRQHANGANVLHLSPDRIRDYVITAPPVRLATTFAESIAASLELVDALENRIENLSKTRDLLLPRLLSGQLDAGGVE